MFDIDKGLKGSLIHHKPLTDIQLKRLLLVFDELHLTPPENNRYFLEKGAICYYYKSEVNKKILYSVDGFDLMKKFINTKPPEVPQKTLPITSVLNYGGEIGSGDGAYQAILLENILPYFKSDIFESQENTLFEKFEKAIEKNHIKILDYKKSNFYLRNSISLKIAYDFDVSDPKSIDYIKHLFIKEKSERVDMFLPSPPFPELQGFNYFPKIKYQSLLRSNQEDLECDFERQFFSIIGKVNKSLALANDYDLIPIFIDEHIHNFYQYKVMKSKANQDSIFLKEWEKLYDFKLMNLSNLLFESTYAFIDNESLNQISVSQIVAYKERCIDELYKIRKELFGEINNLVNFNHNSDDALEIKKLIENKIIPEFAKYQKSQNQVLSKTTKVALKYGVGIGSAYLGLVQGLSPLLISVLSGVSPLLTDDLLQLSGRLKDKKTRKYENTFSYFLNLNKRGAND